MGDPAGVPVCAWGFGLGTVAWEQPVAWGLVSGQSCGPEWVVEGSQRLQPPGGPAAGHGDGTDTPTWPH